MVIEFFITLTGIYFILIILTAAFSFLEIFNIVFGLTLLSVMMAILLYNLSK